MQDGWRECFFVFFFEKGKGWQECSYIWAPRLIWNTRSRCIEDRLFQINFLDSQSLQSIYVPTEKAILSRFNQLWYQWFITEKVNEMRYSLTYRRRIPSKFLGANLPFTTNLFCPSVDPLVPSSASKKAMTCSCGRCILIFLRERKKAKN